MVKSRKRRPIPKAANAVDAAADEVRRVAAHVHEEYHAFKEQGYVSLEIVVLGRELFEIRIPLPHERAR